MPKKKLDVENDNEISHMSFETFTKLRNAFKAKVANQGKTVKEVMRALMEEYIKKK